MLGLISGVGLQNQFTDYDIVIPAEVSSNPAWTSDSSVGTNAYSNTVLTADIASGIAITTSTKFDVIPAKRSGATVLTDSDIENFRNISYAESTATGIKFVATNGRPQVDIPVTLRIYV